MGLLNDFLARGGANLNADKGAFIIYLEGGL